MASKVSSISKNLSELKPFPGFEYDPDSNKTVEGGAQKKAGFTGMYIDIHTKQKWYLKKTKIADDTAERATAQLARFLGANAAECKFVVSRTGELYIASKCAEGFKPLVSSKEKGIKNGWLGSNPLTNENKEKIHKKLKNSIQIEDVAKNLAAFLLLNQNDAHAGNFGTYPQKINTAQGVVEKTRVMSIDFGWGLEGILKKSACKINLFETMSPLGVRGTHGFGGIPTNHIKDFTKIVNSPHFIKALEEVIKKAESENGLEKELKETLKQIIKSNRGEARIKNQLNELAKHMGTEIPKNICDIKGMNDYIFSKLNLRLKERLISMSLAKVMFQIKLRKDSSGKDMTAKQCLEALREVVKKYLPGRKIDLYMPVFKPESVEKLLSKVIEDAKLQASMSKKNTESIASLVEFAELVKAGKNPLIEQVQAFISKKPIVNQFQNEKAKAKNPAIAPKHSSRFPKLAWV